VPGFMTAEQFARAWDTEYLNYLAVFQEMGLVNP